MVSHRTRHFRKNTCATHGRRIASIINETSETFSQRRACTSTDLPLEFRKKREQSEPSREKQPEIGSKEWEANREREIRELRRKERREAAEYVQKNPPAARRKTKEPQIEQLFGWVAVGLLLTFPVLLFLVGIVATPIGTRPPTGYEIMELGYFEDGIVPVYDPRVETARMAFPFLLLPCVGLALYLAVKLGDRLG